MSDRIRPNGGKCLGVANSSNLTGAPAADSRRHFLFVGGPFGPFFRQVADLLQARGAAVLHVNLHGADLLDWGWRDAVTYNGTPDGWLDWLTALMAEHQFTDVVTYGDCGYYSRIMLAEAERRGMIRHVYELGYVRPYYITLDRNGVNGYSSLPLDPMSYRLSDEDTALLPRQFGRMMPFHVGYTIRHCLAHYAGKVFFYRYDSSWPSSPLKQALGYLNRVTMDWLTRRRQRQAERDVLNGDAPFFLCALQKSGDTQIEEHSEFSNVVQFINFVAESFAQHAPADAKLVFKAHPLDYDIESQEAAIRVAGKAHGIEDRLVFLPIGSLTNLMSAAKGMVTVNSTAGLTAAIKGLPTVLIGRAFYRIEGLVSTGNLSQFWQARKHPDWKLAERFLAVAGAKTQVNGSFYAPRGRAMALPVAADRMMARSTEDFEQNINRRSDTLAASGADAPGTRAGLA